MGILNKANYTSKQIYFREFFAKSYFLNSAFKRPGVGRFNSDFCIFLKIIQENNQYKSIDEILNKQISFYRTKIDGVFAEF